MNSDVDSDFGMSESDLDEFIGSLIDIVQLTDSGPLFNKVHYEKIDFLLQSIFFLTPCLPPSIPCLYLRLTNRVKEYLPSWKVLLDKQYEVLVNKHSERVAKDYLYGLI